ncbi:hypothetical protein [Anaeromassilibacillus senegalensis]|uniref:hypothetical protein n=1 Tax=Anaeromassilibacillus senegalensis TaxID=1673717 RepID=UPI000682AA8D|nr:hypothetical protein [Anaeromassilibacillus senegalensis]
MKEIKIINGIYGYRPDGSKIVIPVKAGEVVEVSEEEAARLISLGVAACDDKAPPEFPAIPVAMPGESGNGEPVGENPSDVNDGPEEREEAHFKEHLEEWTNAELKELAENMCIDTAKLKTKAALINAIRSIEFGLGSKGDHEGMPKIDVEKPVV